MELVVWSGAHCPRMANRKMAPRKNGQGTHRQKSSTSSLRNDETREQEKLRLVGNFKTLRKTRVFQWEWRWPLQIIRSRLSDYWPRTLDQLKGLLDCSNIDLNEDTLDAIDELVPQARTLVLTTTDIHRQKFKNKHLRKTSPIRKTSAGANNGKY